MKVSILTGGKDPHYALGLLSGIKSHTIDIEFIGNDEMQDSDVVRSKNVVYYNLRGDQRINVSLTEKIIRVLKYYYKLIAYSIKTDSQLFHILWLNKFIYLDSTLLNIIYKIFGKKLVFTVHNVNIKERDGDNTLLNRLSLRFLYNIVDHIFVHTEKMKNQLIEDFNVKQDKVTVIPFGINNIMPKSDLTKMQARKKLHLRDKEKIILFFGNIAPYKGLEYLLMAIVHVKEKHDDFKLVIVGRIKNCEEYWDNIQGIINKNKLNDYIIEKIEYVPDEEVEVYFKSADLLILPYKYIFQSGVIFLSYNFGLPVIASDVGSLREEVVEGKTGFICQPENPEDLAKKIELYFKSDLYKKLEENRDRIIEYANERYSWEKVGEITNGVYKNLLNIV